MAETKPRRPNTIKTRFTKRVRMITGLFVLAALLCIARLWDVQVMHGHLYMERANQEFTAPVDPLFNRGTIYFTTKDGALIAAATDEHGVSIAVDPKLVADENALYQKLSAIVPIPKSDFMAKVGKPGVSYVVVADHLSTTTGAELERAALPGVVVAADNWRYYPGGSLAAHELGFLAYDGNTLEGQYGLEKEYQSTLERQGNPYNNFFVQLFTDAKSVVSGNQEGDLITTIEPNVEAELVREIQAYAAQWHPDMAGGIIMNPETGAIYAMASEPSFNPNNFTSATDTSVFANPLVSSVYEMGSITKPLTMAAGLDVGVIEPDTTYDDTGCITVSGARICNWDFQARGVIPMQQIISQSLNVGASFIATKLGPQEMSDYFQNKFKLGRRTGIDLPDEASGLVSALNNGSQLSADEASFGQGIAVTPIEMIRALAAIANGGKLVTPHLVSAIKTQSGLTETLDWASGTVQVLKPQTASEVNKMVTVFVDQALFNGQYSLPHHSVGAKTGTAQIAKPGGGGYYSNEYLNSYMSYLPTTGDHAQFITLLVAVDPKNVVYSSQTWTDTFAALNKFLIDYYNLPPDR